MACCSSSQRLPEPVPGSSQTPGQSQSSAWFKLSLACSQPAHPLPSALMAGQARERKVEREVERDRERQREETETEPETVTEALTWIRLRALLLSSLVLETQQAICPYLPFLQTLDTDCNGSFRGVRGVGGVRGVRGVGGVGGNFREHRTCFMPGAGTRTMPGAGTRTMQGAGIWGAPGMRGMPGAGNWGVGAAQGCRTGGMQEGTVNWSGGLWAGARRALPEGPVRKLNLEQHRATFIDNSQGNNLCH
eukprot:1514382-Rhodomonas_salina.1